MTMELQSVSPLKSVMLQRTEIVALCIFRKYMIVSEIASLILSPTTRC